MKQGRESAKEGRYQEGEAKSAVHPNGCTCPMMKRETLNGEGILSMRAKINQSPRSPLTSEKTKHHAPLGEERRRWSRANPKG